MRQAIEIVAGEAAYARLATFKDVDQLNEVVRRYKDMINDMNLRQDVKRNLLKVIEHIKRYSCRFFGVSWQGKRKIAKDLNMSDRTIIRLCQRLETFGFIKQHEMKRSSDMQQTTNAIVIQPLKTESVRQESAKVSDQENNISLKQNNKLLHNTYAAQPVTLYQRFKSFITNINNNDQSLASKMYGVYRANTVALTKYGAYNQQDIENIAMTALHTSVMCTKTKNIRNLPGFFNGVLNKMIDRYVYEESELALKNE